jgi:hypothetical protein
VTAQHIESILEKLCCLHLQLPSRSRPEVLQNMCKTGIQKKNIFKEAITLMSQLKTAPCVSKLK